MKKKLTKIVALVTCAILLVAGTIMGTVAYLTSQATVSNTFTYGKVEITMDDAVTNKYGEPVDAEGSRVEVANAPRTTVDTKINFKLIPGGTYTKNTKIHVESGSETCYLFVKIDTAFANIAQGFALATGWTELDAQNYPGVYYYAVEGDAIVDARDLQQDVLVLNTFTVKTTATKDSLAEFNNTTASITAYAVQTTGFSSVANAWANTFANA